MVVARPRGPDLREAFRTLDEVNVQEEAQQRPSDDDRAFEGALGRTTGTALILSGDRCGRLHPTGKAHSAVETGWRSERHRGRRHGAQVGRQDDVSATQPRRWSNQTTLVRNDQGLGASALCTLYKA